MSNASLLLPGDSWHQHPTMDFRKPSFVVHCPSCLRRDFCKCLLGYFMIAFKSLLPSPLLGCLQGSCRQSGWWCVMTTANMVPQFPCAPLSASICSPSSCAQDVLMCLSLLRGEWQQNWSHLTLANEDTGSQELSMGDLTGSWGAAQF